jgi:hypothetical protein
MLPLLSSSCLATVFVDGMGFVAPPPLHHLSPVPSHDGRQYRPHAHLWMVVGRRGTQAEGGYQEVWRMGWGEIWVRRKWFFINALCMQIRTILKQIKTKAKIARCSGMGKFCPPATALLESPWGNTYAADSCAIRGGGGGEVINKIGRGAHLPRPKSFSCFWASFLKAREAPLKKRKRDVTARPQFWFWIKIRVNLIYLVFLLWLPPLS